MVHTIIRPNAFMQTLFLPTVSSIKNDKSFRMTLGGGHIGMIDTRDIVDVFEKVLLSSGYDEQILTLTGPDSISLYEAAHIFSQEVGYKITYIPVPPVETEQWLSSFGMDGWYLSTLCDYSTAFSQNHQDVTTNDVEHVTGHPARSLEVFTREVFGPMLQQ